MVLKVFSGLGWGWEKPFKRECWYKCLGDTHVHVVNTFTIIDFIKKQKTKTCLVEQ